MNADDGLLHVADWADFAALLTVGSIVVGLLWWAIRSSQAAERARMTAQVAAARALAEQAHKAIADVDARLSDVEKTMATRADLNTLRNDLQQSTAQLRAAIETSSDKTVREVERLLAFALKQGAP